MRDLYGASYRVKEEITISDLLARLQHVIGRETEVIRAQLLRNHIELIAGHRPASSTRTRCRSTSRAPPIAPHPDRGQDRHRHRHRAGPAGERRLRRRPGARLRPDPRPSSRCPDSHGRRRRRRDRGGVRLDVRRARHPGDPGREARPDARLLRPRDRRVAEVPPARPHDVVPLRRGGRLGRELGRAGTITTLASGKRIAAEVVMHSAGRQGNTASAQPRSGRARRRQPRPARGRTSTTRPRCRTSTRSAT